MKNVTQNILCEWKRSPLASKSKESALKERKSDPQWAQVGPKWPQSDPKLLPSGPKVVPNDLKSHPKGSQGTPKSEAGSLKVDFKNLCVPLWTTFKKKDGCVLLEPHYLLCFWEVALREPQYLLRFRRVPRREHHYLLCFFNVFKSTFKPGACNLFPSAWQPLLHTRAWAATGTTFPRTSK